jgi:hypothetical protein
VKGEIITRPIPFMDWFGGMPVLMRKGRVVGKPVVVGFTLAVQISEGEGGPVAQVMADLMSVCESSPCVIDYVLC